MPTKHISVKGDQDYEDDIFDQITEHADQSSFEEPSMKNLRNFEEFNNN